MGTRTVRQIANETNTPVAEVFAALQSAGVKINGEGGSATFDDKDPNIGNVGKQRRQPQQQSTTPPGGNAMFAEVFEKLDKKLDPVAVRARLYAQQSLEQKIGDNILNMTSEEAMALLAGMEGEHAHGIDGNFDFFSQTSGFDNLNSCLTAITSGVETKQLAEATPSATKSEPTSIDSSASVPTSNLSESEKNLQPMPKP